MDLVTFKNSLSDHIETHGTIEQLVSKVQTLPNYAALKLDPELTLWVCKCVENIVSKKTPTSTVDKSTIVIETFKSLFPDLTPEEHEYIKKQIQYFWTNKIIKRKGFIKKIAIYGYQILKKKFI
jgi:hypothetical protein